MWLFFLTGLNPMLARRTRHAPSVYAVSPDDIAFAPANDNSTSRQV
jgi:hypothetical protein